MAPCHDPASPRRLPTGAVEVAGWVVGRRDGRVYLHAEGDPGGLRPAPAHALAVALATAASQADRACRGPLEDPHDLDMERRLEQAHYGGDL
jgi:hypothetical protein